MTKQSCNLSESKVENTVEKFRSALIAWLGQKQTGKLSFEVDANQGGIRDCRLKTDTKL